MSHEPPGNSVMKNHLCTDKKANDIILFVGINLANVSQVLFKSFREKNNS